jgi:competence protein ComGC
MQHTATSPKAFTLVEVLVISPIVILFIGAFIALAVNLTGESLTLRERNVAAYDIQASLDEIESSVSKATAILVSTTGTTISSPQGKNNTSSAFTNTNGSGQPETLILRSIATTKGPTDPTRAIVYTGSGACNSQNPIYEYLTVFFVADDLATPDTTDKALFKRTIMPSATVCAPAWQRGSCEPSMVAGNTSVCKASDEKLISNVSTFTLNYYVGSSTTPVADSAANTATDVEASIAVSKTIAGNAVNASGSSRAKSLNL